MYTQTKYFCLILWVTLVASEAPQGIYELIANENPHRNLVVSPLSIRIALGMLYMGTGGQTAVEIGRAIRLSEKKQDVVKKYSKMVNDVKSLPSLRLIDNIIVNDRYYIKPEFNKSVEVAFKAVAQKMNISKGNIERIQINQNVLSLTDGKIKNILSPDSFASSVSAVLVNALFYRDHWKNRFYPESTTNEGFNLSNKGSVTVPMMYRNGRFMAGDFPDSQVKVLALPYLSSEISMLIFLPYKVDGLNALEEKIGKVSWRLQLIRVNVKLPRFKIEFNINLKNTLKDMGIRDLFTNKCNFSNLIDGKVRAKIAEVSHKAFIRVDEYGTDAAAATNTRTARRKTKFSKFNMNFTADRPFAFMIRDNKYIYVQGHVVAP